MRLGLDSGLGMASKLTKMLVVPCQWGTGTELDRQAPKLSRGIASSPPFQL